MRAMEIYRARRAEFAARMGEGVAVLFATPVARRNNDVEHPYRQSSDLYYLSGFDEPESALVIVVDSAGARSTLFVRPRNPERETWDGPRAGIDGVVQDFGLDEGRLIDELEIALADLCGRSPRLWHRFGLTTEHDALVCRALDRIRAKPRSGDLPPSQMACPAALLADLRLRKSEWEVGRMRAAAEITRDAHLAAIVGSRKNNPTANAREAATVVQATGPENCTSSSSLNDTSADHSSARIPSPNASHSIPSPRTKGHWPHFLV